MNESRQNRKDPKHTVQQKNSNTSTPLRQTTLQTAKNVNEHEQQPVTPEHRRTNDEPHDSDKKLLSEVMKGLKNTPRSTFQNATLTTSSKVPSMSQHRDDETKSPKHVVDLSRQIDLVRDIAPGAISGARSPAPSDNSTRSPFASVAKSPAPEAPENSKMHYLTPGGTFAGIRSPSSNYIATVPLKSGKKSGSRSAAQDDLLGDRSPQNLGTKSVQKLDARGSSSSGVVKMEHQGAEFEAVLQSVKPEQIKYPGLKRDDNPKNTKEAHNHEEKQTSGQYDLPGDDLSVDVAIIIEERAPVGHNDGKGSTKSVRSTKSITSTNGAGQPKNTHEMINRLLVKDQEKKDEENKRMMEEEEQKQQQQQQQLNQGADQANKEDKAKEADPSGESRARYDLETDYAILNYIDTKPKTDNYTSRNFWKYAVDTDNLLDKKRSVESLRDRYRHNLRYLDENDIERIHKWVESHGKKGYLTFKTQACKDQTGRIIHVKRLDAIETEVPPVARNLGNYKKTSTEPKKPAAPAKKPKTTKLEREFETEEPAQDAPQVRQKQTRLSNRVSSTSAVKKPRILSDEDEDIESLDEVEHRQATNKPITASRAQQLLDNLYEERVDPRKQAVGPREMFEEEFEEPEQQQASSRQIGGKKRKEYEGKYDTNEDAPPRKVMGENPGSRGNSQGFEATHRFLNTQEEQKVVVKEKWLRELATKHNLPAEDALSLFYQCSMNSKILENYLKGAAHLRWDEDEDTLLREKPEQATRILSRYKSADNVNMRLEFLDKIDQVQRQGQSQKQSSQTTNKRRAPAHQFL